MKSLVAGDAKSCSATHSATLRLLGYGLASAQHLGIASAYSRLWPGISDAPTACAPGGSRCDGKKPRLYVHRSTMLE